VLSTQNFIKNDFILKNFSTTNSCRAFQVLISKFVHKKRESFMSEQTNKRTNEWRKRRQKVKDHFDDWKKKSFDDWSDSGKSHEPREHVTSSEINSIKKRYSVESTNRGKKIMRSFLSRFIPVKRPVYYSRWVPGFFFLCFWTWNNFKNFDLQNFLASQSRVWVWHTLAV
jgi:hypothetical protein